MPNSEPQQSRLASIQEEGAARSSPMHPAAADVVADSLVEELNETRERTDSHLHEERKVADEAIATDHEAELALEKKREETDADLSRGRRQDRPLPAPERAVETDGDARRLAELLGDERERAERALHREQERADEALEEERKHADEILELERERLRQQYQEQLALLREVTDEVLADERSQTNQAVEEIAERLADEKDAHGMTKVALTSRDQFFAIVSHDLRNPLNAILGASAVLSKATVAEGTDGLRRVRDSAGMIQRLAGHMGRMIGDLLDVESIAAGKLQIRKEPHDLVAIAGEAIEVARAAGALRGQRFELVALAPRAPCCVDRERVLQVFGNVLGNAVKFAPSESTVTILVGLVGKDVRIAVRDRGPGVPRDQLHAIFDRFSQLGRDDRRGLGLGLFISKWIVEGHRGRIWCENAPDGGAIFVVSLPEGSSSSHEKIRRFNEG